MIYLGLLVAATLAVIFFACRVAWLDLQEQREQAEARPGELTAAACFCGPQEIEPRGQFQYVPEVEMPDDIPNVEDSSAWGPRPVQPPMPSFERALGVVVSAGERLRLCASCQSSATEIDGEEWVWHEGDVWLRVVETCMDCEQQRSYHVTAGLWTAMEATRVWDQARVARQVAHNMARDQSSKRDLDDLDGV